MLPGFEEETAPLNDFEKATILPWMIDVLKTAVSEEWAITNGDIAVKYKFDFNKYLGAARIRKIINHIRMNDLILCLVASSKGYWIEHHEERLLEYIDSLHSRASIIYALAGQLKKQVNFLKHVPQGTQLSLFD